MDFVEHKNENDDDDDDDDDNNNNNNNNLIVVTTLIILIFLFSCFTRGVKSPYFSLGCDDVSHFTSMSSETSEAYKMPKTVQRQYGQRIYALFIFERLKNL
jgi:hypothetical protein